jgi:hypothetical protein
MITQHFRVHALRLTDSTQYKYTHNSISSKFVLVLYTKEYNIGYVCLLTFFYMLISPYI